VNQVRASSSRSPTSEAVDARERRAFGIEIGMLRRRKKLHNVFVPVSMFFFVAPPNR